jgi:hypothetical protein
MSRLWGTNAGVAREWTQVLRANEKRVFISVNGARVDVEMKVRATRLRAASCDVAALPGRHP